MRKIFILIATLSFSQNIANADSLDRALNAGTIYGGVGTAAGVASTYSNVQTNASLRRNIDTQTALMKMQAAQQGVDLRDANDIAKERIVLYHQCRYFLIDAKLKAKDEGDTEMLKLIKKHWSPWTTGSAIYAARKVAELREQRNGIQSVSDKK